MSLKYRELKQIAVDVENIEIGIILANPILR